MSSALHPFTFPWTPSRVGGRRLHLCGRLRCAFFSGGGGDHQKGTLGLAFFGSGFAEVYRRTGYPYLSVNEKKNKPHFSSLAFVGMYETIGEFHTAPFLAGLPPSQSVVNNPLLLPTPFPLLHPSSRLPFASDAPLSPHEYSSSLLFKKTFRSLPP